MTSGTQTIKLQQLRLGFQNRDDEGIPPFIFEAYYYGKAYSRIIFIVDHSQGQEPTNANSSQELNSFSVGEEEIHRQGHTDQPA